MFFGGAKLVVSVKISVADFRKICWFWVPKLVTSKYFLSEMSGNTDTVMSTKLTINRTTQELGNDIIEVQCSLKG